MSVTDLVPTACRSCPAFNTSVTGKYANWCIAHNRSALQARPHCERAGTKDDWIKELAKVQLVQRVSSLKQVRAA